MTKNRTLLAILLAVGVAGPNLAQVPGYDSPYTEGTVWGFTFVRVNPGMLWEYVRSLKAEMAPIDEAKKQGLMLSYRIVVADASTPDDWNVVIISEYKDMATLDGFDAKMDAIASKAGFNEQKDKAAVVKRGDLRRLLGSKLGRELLLK